ncbi:hypothetical protein [Aquabacterium sp. OR-4]|uniref:hypothetical protein n=1 Tax=Aquabacterium sp. OR-4 TaxID=2978127 RepID=UPI0028CAEC64|nr:hypothetical protein [Aquabacterium sp. OR-4]MDT7835050.1 hypothetical protein [Aquabacterium sp. OR-4]
MSEDARWLAEAAMYRILRRTLPAQRHEVLGALSALKLQLAVARRRALRDGEAGASAAAAGAAAAQSAAQFEAMAEQQQAAQAALTELRLWDGVVVQQRPLQVVWQQAAAWVRQAAAMRGHRLDELQLDAPGAQQAEAPEVPEVAVPAAHHRLLGLLYEAIDRLEQPSHLLPRLQRQAGGWCLWLQAGPRTDALPAPAGLLAPPPAPDLQIGPALLAALAQTGQPGPAAHAAAGEGGRWSLISAPGLPAGPAPAAGLAWLYTPPA